jgi:hypothetical protein
MRTDFALRESFITTRALAKRDALLAKHGTMNKPKATQTMETSK